jgi:hypothetical protein
VAAGKARHAAAGSSPSNATSVRTAAAPRSLSRLDTKRTPSRSSVDRRWRMASSRSSGSAASAAIVRWACWRLGEGEVAAVGGLDRRRGLYHAAGAYSYRRCVASRPRGGRGGRPGLPSRAEAAACVRCAKNDVRRSIPALRRCAGGPPASSTGPARRVRCRGSSFAPSSLLHPAGTARPPPPAHTQHTHSMQLPATQQGGCGVSGVGGCRGRAAAALAPWQLRTLAGCATSSAASQRSNAAQGACAPAAAAQQGWYASVRRGRRLLIGAGSVVCTSVLGASERHQPPPDQWEPRSSCS